MSKAVLIIDMSYYCKECPLRKDIRCNAIKEDEDNNIEYYLNNKNPCRGKPKWCPLKEVPDELHNSEDMDEYCDGYDDGWNDCLKTILEE